MNSVKLSTRSFIDSYDSYYIAIKNYLKPGIKILEIGGGAFPSVHNRNGYSYSIVDPDGVELEKSPDDIIKINSTVQDIKDLKFDLIISKMVLEHVKNPREFHKHIIDLLRPNGHVIHFFACRYSIPAFVNRFLPEKIGELMLRLLKNRDTSIEPKYKAYYKNTFGHTRQQLLYFSNLGYDVFSYDSFVGHKYFDKLPVLKTIENIYTKTLVLLKLKILTTVALVVLKKND